MAIRERFLKSLANILISYPHRMSAVVIILTILLGGMATQIKQTMRWSDLLPEKNPHTIQFDKVLKEFVSASNIVIVVQGEENRIKSFADSVVPLIKNLKDPKDEKPYAKRIDYTLDTKFIRKHGLMLIKENDLKNIKEIFTNPNLIPFLANLNNSFEKEYIQRAEPLSTREKEDSAFMLLDGIETFVHTFDKSLSESRISSTNVHSAVDKLLTGEPYMLSYDKTTLIINITPNFTMMDINKLMKGTEAVRKTLDGFGKNDIKTGLTGMIPLQYDEMIYTEKSLSYTSVIAIIGIFFLLVIVFRMWAAPFLAVINLIIGVIWATGLTALTVGTLNLMTVMMVVILLGLGIDFSLHIISRFTEMRSQGSNISESLYDTFLKSGKGIITGGLTTAVAFFTLATSSSRGMKEMGIVTGGGLIAILICTFLCLPLLLIFHESKKDQKNSLIEKKPKDISLKKLGIWSVFLGKKYILSLIACVIITGLLAFFGSKITFDWNYMNMEPKGVESVELQDVILDKFDLSMDYALIITDTIEESASHDELLKKLPTVASVDSISRYLPPKEKQQKRIPHIKEIRASLQNTPIKSSINNYDKNKLIAELIRLEMNIMELQDMAYLGGQDKVDAKCSRIIGNPENTQTINHIQTLLDNIKKENTNNKIAEFQNIFSPYFKKQALTMASPALISLDDMPESILDRYANTDRTQFLTTIFPYNSIWSDLLFGDRFVADMNTVSQKATGLPVIFKSLLEIIGKDGRRALLLTLIVVFFLLLMDFRKLSDTIIAMIPLVTGLVWMVGFMHLFSMQFTIMNVMGLPMIVGIGIDDGVHIVHRWRQEGRGSLFTVFSSTGKAILLTTLTTMIAFGSLTLSIWPGFASLGSSMTIGVACCFLTTIIILPAIIGFKER